ncbi:MAG: PfkB family carbohydrate kinase [Solirubrobacteraceae bacterium]
MIVAGGTYEEICREPASAELAGSGLRAAAVLLSVATSVELASAVDVATADEASTLIGGLNLAARWYDRSEGVSFTYLTPLSAPIIGGRHARTSEPLVIEADHALVFGMIEGQPVARARGLVFDPQQPNDLVPLGLQEIQADRLAIVANAGETRVLGAARSVEDGARGLMARTGAEVVVTKQAARGALVTTRERQERVGPHPTSRVWPIGSGDVFAAGFAWAWLEQDASPVEAARTGSRAAAQWCETQRLDLPASAFQDASQPELDVQEGRVYLAGPFFDLGQRWLVNLVRDNLRGLGGEVFSPMHDVGVGDDIATADLAGLDDCTAVLALLDHSDVGTVFEVGWARRQGKPVIGYAERPDPEGLKMLRGTQVEMHNDLSTAVYRALWTSMGAPLP